MITVKNLTFRYRCKGYIYRDFSLTIEVGESMACSVPTERARVRS